MGGVRAVTGKFISTCIPRRSTARKAGEVGLEIQRACTLEDRVTNGSSMIHSEGWKGEHTAF